MANQFVNLPAPAANGSGAAVDVSTFGALKTVAVQGNGGVFEPFVTIECSNELVPVHWYPLRTFTTPTEDTFERACHWMRATVSNYRGGGAPSVDVGGTDDGTTFAQLTVPVGNGTGAGVDVSALGLFKTVQVGGAFRGSLNVEVSEDAGVTWAQAFSFAIPGAQSVVIAADFMRVSRNGVPQIDPGTPVVWVGGTSPIGGGGGGGIDVQKDGIDVVNPANTINFLGPAITVTDAGGGVADVQIASTAIIRTFRYTATGAETTAGFIAAIPAPPMADANYNAIVSQDVLADDLAFQMPHTSFTTTQLTIKPGANMTAGDKIYITLIPFTIS